MAGRFDHTVTPFLGGCEDTPPSTSRGVGLDGLRGLEKKPWPINDFAEGDVPSQVRIRWCLPETEPLWLVPSSTTAEALVAAGINPGEIWTSRELANLLAIPGITHDQVRRVILAKIAVAGEVAEVRPSAPETCYACRGRRFWRRVEGPTVCAVCHPPPSPDVVAAWIGGGYGVGRADDAVGPATPPP
jgi:hypothetical protein